MKQPTFWIITNDLDQYLYWTLDYTRNAAMGTAAKELGGTWKQLYRRGFRAKKVKVVPNS